MSDLVRRREFLRDLGVGAAAAPFVLGLPGLARGEEKARKRRMVVVFTPNGVVQPAFWPDEEGADFKLKECLQPLEPWKDQLTVLKGVCNKVRADGDSHMRGIACLLTGIELFPGNIQGGSHTPAGWAKGISIDQEIKNHLQTSPATRTRFGSLEFGVGVPNRADTWTRMVYAGPNQPIAPVSDPYQMLEKMYGRMKDQAALRSVLDAVKEDLKKVGAALGAEDRRLIEEQANFVRQMERELEEAAKETSARPMPQLPPGVRDENDNIPKLSRMQIDLLVEGFKSDAARVATLQYTNSVGQAKMKWIGVDEGHHELSHKDDKDKPAQDKLVKINRWFAGEIAHLVKRLADTPEPGASGTMLDHTTVVWTNELGKGNSHTLNDIPFVLVGGGLGFKTGRSLKFKQVAHNRLLLTFAHAFGLPLEKFGNPALSEGGPLSWA